MEGGEKEVDYLVVMAWSRHEHSGQWVEPHARVWLGGSVGVCEDWMVMLMCVGGFG